jgi:hypothetical protein
MKKYFINYASNGFLQSQKEGIRLSNKFNFESFALSDKDIDIDFYEKNKNILNQKRGGGYWLWKPYLINRFLNQISNGDYLVYMDSGAFFIKDPSFYLEQIDEEQGLIAFTMMQKTSKWTKGDCFYDINTNKNYEFMNENQVQATYIFLKKCDFSVSLVKDWLNFCTKKNLITDCDNIYMKNLPDFIDHRHDQSIFSLLCYNRNVKMIPQIDQYCVEHGLSIDRKIIDRHGIRN